MNIYFLRHGETIWNKKGITQGHKNSPLTLKGKNSAKKRGKILRKENIEKIYSSNLGRCIQTAKIINQQLKIKLVKTPELRERNFGNFNGSSNKIILSQLNLSDLNKKAPKGESFNDMKKRIINFIKNLSTKKLKKVLLITHEGPTKAILSKYYNVSPLNKKCDTSDKSVYYFEIDRGIIKKGSLSKISI